MKWSLNLQSIKEKIQQEIDYFSLSPKDQASFLENNNRLRLARKKYLQLNNLPKVIELSKKLNDPKSVFHYQIKNNDIDEAIQTSELYQLYQLGAPLCEKKGYLIKAAHMYTHFDLLKAASLYKQAHLWMKAADCYIRLEQYYRALECIEQLSDDEMKNKGYILIEKKGDELYETDHYELALKLYVRLQLWEKALNAANQLHNSEVQKLIYEKLALHALDDNELEKAATFYEHIDISKSVQLFIQVGNIMKAATLLETLGKVEEAIHLLLKSEKVSQAWDMAEKHNLLRIMLPYYKDIHNLEKIKNIYKRLHEYEEGAQFFMEINSLDIAAEFAKKIDSPQIAAHLLENMEFYKAAAPYYLLCNQPEECKMCLKKAGFTPAEIENYFLVKNYPNL